MHFNSTRGDEEKNTRRNWCLCSVSILIQNTSLVRACFVSCHRINLSDPLRMISLAYEAYISTQTEKRQTTTADIKFNNVFLLFEYLFCISFQFHFHFVRIQRRRWSRIENAKIFIRTEENWWRLIDGLSHRPYCQWRRAVCVRVSCLTHAHTLIGNQTVKISLNSYAVQVRDVKSRAKWMFNVN